MNYNRMNQNKRSSIQNAEIDPTPLSPSHVKGVLDESAPTTFGPRRKAACNYEFPHSRYVTSLFFFFNERAFAWRESRAARIRCPATTGTQAENRKGDDDATATVKRSATPLVLLPLTVFVYSSRRWLARVIALG